MKILTFIILLMFIIENNFAQEMKNYNPLTDFEKYVILQKGTEKPFTGEYYEHKESGVYKCKQCNAELYKSTDKFDSHCGWPSFDDEIEGAVKRVPDADGRRTEIVCANCNGHLGHVFLGERFTEKNTRHCVNSVSLNFVADNLNPKTETIYFAGGCFWGVEYYFINTPGVISTSVGFTGGKLKNPTYKEVCNANTGHAEVTEVVYNPEKVDFEDLAKLFFEIHDFTQIDRQGPDIGEQYRTEIFYTTEHQKEVSEKLIESLMRKGHEVATEVTKATDYYKAEAYHQDYYRKKGGQPYCHARKKIF